MVADGETTEYNYYEDGNRKDITYPSGEKETYEYYDNDKLKRLINLRADGTEMDNYYYTYDEAGNQITKYETINGVDKGETIYTYDEMNRLETVTEPDTRLTEYSYDMAGNRESETVTMDSTTINEKIYSYNVQNRLSSVTSYVYGTLTETIDYEYDANGNQLTSSIGGVIQVTNTYNLLNELVKTETSETTVESVYNGEGLRVEKQVGAEVTTYLYEYQQVVMEFDSSGNMKSKNVVGINLISRTIDGQKLYYMYNGNADVTALIDSVGVIQAYYYYDAFGVPVEGMTDLGGIDNPYRYKGYQYDEETGLYYLNARMYDPVTARFMQEDTYRGTPGDPLSLNYYTYTMNNPLVYWDPSGNVSVYINNQFIEGLDLEIKNGTTIVNLRQLVEGMGGTVEWTSGLTEMHANVKSTYKDKTIMHYILPSAIGSDYDELRMLTGNYQDPQGYGYEKGGSVRVGLRAVAEELGFNVAWDGETQSIRIRDESIPIEYEQYINQLKIAHPNWTFEFYDAGISLNDYIELQYSHNIPTPKTDIDALKETDKGIIKSRSMYVLADGERFFLSTRSAVEFFVNPLNFLNDNNVGYGTNDGLGYNDKGIFQFMELGFDSSYQTLAGVKSMLKGTYFDSDIDNYAKWFFEASQKNKINPFMLVSKAIVEGGANEVPPSLLLTGYNFKGSTVYNFFGIGAGDGNALYGGASHALNHGWTTPKKAIDGGAEFVSRFMGTNNGNAAYIQDTYYTLRYNLPGYINSGQVEHQYASNIADAWLKGYLMADDDIMSLLGSQNLKFKIPKFR